MSISEQFVGQERAINQIQTTIDACMARGEILPHTLLIAPPGVGKTYLAREIAYEIEAPFLSIALPADTKTLDAYLMNHCGLLLIDEVHQATRKTLDSLLPFLTDGVVRNRMMEETNRRLTVIAATTDPQKLPDAFTSRFRLRPAFEDYTKEEIAEIIRRAGWTDRGLDVPIADELAAASLGNPRQALALLSDYADLSEVQSEVSLEEVLDHSGITEQGLRPEHLQYLRSLRKQGGVASMATLGRMVSMPAEAMAWLERDLLKLGIIGISSAGRELRSARSWEPQRDKVDVGSEQTDTYPNTNLNPYTGEPR